MRAIDTNIVVRALVGDHAVQAMLARDLIRQSKVFVPLTVILETEWVLPFDVSFRPKRSA